MIKENRVSKYILYAIGEIILVVIGILIALQINNWNQHNKELAKEQNIIEGLQIEFTKNRELISNILTEIENNTKANYLLME